MLNRSFFTYLILSLLILTISVSNAHAADPAMPPPIQELVKDGAVARYLGDDQGLKGWVTFKGGQEQYFYTTPDGQGIVMGILFNPKGDVITMRQIEQLRAREGKTLDRLAGITPQQSATAETPVTAPTTAPAPQTKPKNKSEQFFADIEQANWITLGDKTAPVMYSFIDPQCPHCKELINGFKKAGVLDNGQLQLRLIPVGMLSEESLYQSAFLLASPTAALDLLKLVEGNQNAVPVDKNLPTLGVEKNLSLMQRYKIDVTPFSVYRNKKGEVKILRGKPKNIKNLMKELR